MTISFSAGQLITSNQMNLLAPTLAIKSTNQSVVNSTTLVNDLDIVFTFVANQTVHIVANLGYQMSVTNFGVQVAWLPGGTLTIKSRAIQGPSSAASAGTNANLTNAQSQLSTSTGANIYAGTTINVTYLIREELIFTTGASGGTLQMQWANGFAGTDTSTMMAGSFAIARYVA